MKPIKPAALLLVGLIGLSSLGADQPTTQPSDPSAANAQTDNSQQGRSGRHRTGGNRGSDPTIAVGLEKYAILQSRSIFVKGNQNIARDNSSGRSSGFSRPSNPDLRKPEQLLVFNGVIVVDDQANAMIEDQGSLKVNLVQAGDAVSQGKVSAISFDSLTYEANGSTTQVMLGQNLLGEYPIAMAASPAPTSAVPTSQPASAVPAPVATDDGGAPPPPPAVTPGGSSSDDILARLRAKRNQELGIK